MVFLVHVWPRAFKVKEVMHDDRERDCDGGGFLVKGDSLTVGGGGA